MNLIMGNQRFVDIQIPLLWGTRAVVRDGQDRLSVIDLSGGTARVEIVGDRVAPGVEYRPSVDGITILRNGRPLYTYNPVEKTLSSIDLSLPDSQITPSQTRVGTNVFAGNVFGGTTVGLAVTEDGIAVGAPLPSTLANLLY